MCSKGSKYISALLIWVVYITILLMLNVVHNRFFEVHVVLYSSIFDAIMSAIFTSLIAYMCFIRRQFANFELILLVIVLLQTGYIYAISFPTVIDRSLSFYLIEKLKANGGALRFDSFEEIISKEYVKEARLVDVRLTEQLNSGTIILKEGCVELTKFGSNLATVSNFIRTHFLPKKRNLLGDVGDSLTQTINEVANENSKCASK